MPTIHVSEYVWKQISDRRKGSEPPTDTLERIIDRDYEQIEGIVEEKIFELVVDDALAEGI